MAVVEERYRPLPHYRENINFSHPSLVRAATAKA
jgi:hypothetical protein